MNSGNLSQEAPSGEELDGQSKPPKRRRVRFWLVVSAALLTATGGWVFAQDSREGARGGVGKASPEPIRALTVATVIAEREEGYEVVDRFVGRAEAARQSDLGFELAGTLISVSVEEGDFVEAGQELALLDTDRLEARRAELAALLEQMDAALSLADKTLERFRSAVKTNAVSAQQVDEAVERKLNAEAGRNRIQSQINAIDVDLRKSVLVAPFSGSIAVRNADEGAIVSPGQTLLRLLEVDRLEIRVGFSAEAATRLERGANVLAARRSADPVTAKVARILPQRDLKTRTVDVILTIDGAAGLIRPGDLVEVSAGREIEKSGQPTHQADDDRQHEQVTVLEEQFRQRMDVRFRIGRFFRLHSFPSD